VFACALGAYGVGLLPPPSEPWSIAAVPLHYANYYIVAHDNQGFLTGTGVYWSLAVEEHFYLLFPFFFLFLSRIGVQARSKAALLLFFCIGFLAWRCVLVFAFHASSLHIEVASDTRFDSLLFGCALAVYENPGLDRSALSEQIWKYVLFPLGLADLLICFAVRDDSFRDTLRYSLQGLSLVPLFVCAVRYPDWAIIRPLNFRPIAFTGVLSYSLYLIHLIVLDGLAANLGTRLQRPVQAVLALAISLMLAWLMYEVVEKPCARLRQRLRV
jgi:peptidoglycan/LPS O-acetylase OafA/YrhL